MNNTHVRFLYIGDVPFYYVEKFLTTHPACSKIYICVYITKILSNGHRVCWAKLIRKRNGTIFFLIPFKCRVLHRGPKVQIDEGGLRVWGKGNIYFFVSLESKFTLFTRKKIIIFNGVDSKNIFPIACTFLVV